MQGGSLVREARRRAGLTQEELARRVGTTQSAVARVEGGHTEPSLRRIERWVQACGFELEITMSARDDSDWALASANLSMTVDDRVRQHQAALRFALAGRRALEHQRARA